MMEFKKAKLDNLKAINELIFESRSVWNYPEDYARASLPLITIDEAFLNSQIAYEIHDSEFVGFLAFENHDDDIFLEHLWIKKSRLKQGIGNAAAKFIDETAVANGWKKLKVFPDPSAEGFYLKCGFKNTGEKFPSRVPGGPTFTLFEKVY